MDRFIVSNTQGTRNRDGDLKSNMDRFIASAKRPLICSRKLFKIQYG